MTTDLEGLLREHAGAPGHGPDFETRLWAKIAAEAAPAAVAAAPADAAPAAELGTAAQQRVSAPARRHHLRRVLLAAAAVAAAAALTLGIVASHHSVQPFLYPDPASAAEVAANVRTALSSIRTLRATEQSYFKVVKGPPESQWKDGWTTADWWKRARIYSDEEFKSLGMENGSPYFAREQIVAKADGRWRKDAPEGHEPSDPVDQSSDDQATGVSQIYWPGMALHVIKNTSLGAPDDGSKTPSGIGHVQSPLQFIGPATLALMARGTMEEATYEGRPALTISCAIPPRPLRSVNMEAHYFDAVEYTIDRETWLIVRTRYLLRDEVVWQSRLTDIRVNVPVADTELVPSCPPRTTVREASEGFRRVSFAEAPGACSTSPLAPTSLPQGFQPFAAAVAKRATFDYWTDGGGKKSAFWPASSDVVQLAYRAGFMSCIVTTRTQPLGAHRPTAKPASDPFVRDLDTAEDSYAFSGGARRVRLTGGAWRGVTAYVVTPLLESPHLWAWHDSVLVTIGGDLTRDQLLAAANSLEPLD
jgi:hypothetical protein